MTAMIRGHVVEVAGREEDVTDDSIHDVRKEPRSDFQRCHVSVQI